ncbi:hypothetical protein SE19_07960 [Acidiplasma aeolicum]|uniref:Glycosyltransferase subfamily 4-like N-terminal domain-containing protein n=2 Tax=Acidiplasma TaxID=507753 RepID=A0A0P9CKK5_9ARCH|nr:hypothetical protein [Acidiplasma aeolicum]KPV45886.1 hypothetical protein SE19_07960 [Acidiplasma aeolicum]KQB33681.1 hypothetical protein AOG54_06720 [Acidiplasma aeolicum]
MKIKIVQPNSKTFNGIKTYSTNLFKDLLKNGIAAELKRLPKVEFSIRGKKIGGWTSQRLLSFLVGNADIVHSTSYMELTPHTNVVTIHDLFSIINNKYKSQMIRDFHIKTLKTIERRRINVVVQGEHIAEQVREYIPDVPIDIIPTKVFVKPATQNPYPDN